MFGPGFAVTLALSQLLLHATGSVAFPGMIPFKERGDNHDQGIVITMPKPMEFTGIKLIPGKSMMLLSRGQLLTGPTADAHHPYIAPGPHDQRGPFRKYYLHV